MFWRSQTYLKVSIVLHPKSACIEIIAQEEDATQTNKCPRQEYNRLYLNAELIENNLDEDMVDLMCEENMKLEQNKHKSRQTILKEVTLKMVTKYVYVRLNQTLNSSNRKVITVLWSDGDVLVKNSNGVMQPDFILEHPPKGLVPFQNIETSRFAI